MKKHLYAICAVTLASPAIALPAKPAIAKTGIVADYNKTPGLCDAMIASRATASGQREWFLQFPPAVESDLAVEVHADMSSFGSFRSRSHFELVGEKGDGTVYGLHKRHAMQYTDSWFFGAPADMDKQWLDVDEDRLFKKSTLVFPQSFDGMVMQDLGSAQVATYAIRQVAKGQKPFAYRLRTMASTPFIWQDTAYFLLTSMDAEHRHLAAVVSPGVQGAAEETCLFRREDREAITLRQP